MSSPTAVKPTLKRFANAADAVAALAAVIVPRLADGVARHGAASFIASGGTTPGVLFDALAEHDAPWDKVFVTPTDERWVTPTDDRSNEKLVRTRLLRGRAASASFVPLMTEHATPAEGEEVVDGAVARMPRPFDVTLLGMGVDGHMASLFPGAAHLAQALDISSPQLVCAITPRDTSRTGLRMSLTLRAILASRVIAILIRGEEKMAAYRAALAARDVWEMPIRAVLHQSQTPVEVYWSP